MDGAQWNFRAVKTILYGAIVMDTFPYTCAKTHRMYNNKGPPNANHGLRVIMCPCSFVEYSGGSLCACGGKGCMETLCIFHAILL